MSPILQNERQHIGPMFEYYRCTQEFPNFQATEGLEEPEGYFRFGQSVVCYGRTAGNTSTSVNGCLFDASQRVHTNGQSIFLPFDLTQVVDNLRYESYVQSQRRWVENHWVKNLYYSLRPLFPVSLRKHLQKVYLRDWARIPFPNWPVDRSVDLLFEKLLVLAMQVLQTDRLPFIWFWPDGHRACAIVTHDVETTVGRDFSERLMDIDDAFGVKASFQIVPEERYAVPSAYLQSINERGFEINIQGLNHAGTLFRNKEEFVRCAEKINQYAKEFGARGFRSPILYRNLDWFSHLNFSYDMSVPNVARLDPQRGGCCTVMPYFLPGGMTELPVTMTQDYTLFYILKDYSNDLWRKQANTILGGNGLMNFIIHPDYTVERRAQDTFKALLEDLSRLREERGLWVTLPREVDRWWRERNEMNLVRDNQTWRVEGPGSDRAVVAYARLDKNQLVYEIDRGAKRA